MDQSNISISRKGLIQVIIPLLLGTSILLALSFLLFQAESELDREARARTTLAALTDLGKGIPEAISAVTTYAYFGGSEYKVRYEQIVKRVDGSYNQLNHLYKDKQKRLAELKHLHQLEFGVFEILNVIVSATDRSETSELLRIESMRWQLESSGKQFLRELNEFTETEKVSQKPTNARVFRDSMKALLLFGVLVNVGVSLWLANVFSHGITKRLLNVLNNSNRLANKETLLPQMTGTDEIAALDTAFHKMAAALEDAARRERAIIDNAADVICSISKDQRFVSVSPASSKIWGYSPSELTGKHLSEIVVGDDIAVVTRAQEESLETKQSTTFDTRIKHQSGAILHSLWSMEWSEEQETFFCVTHDYTKRKMAEDLLRESEATIRLIIESLPVSLMVLDQDGYIHQSNRTTERMFTLTKDMLNTSNVVDLIPAAASLEEKCLGQVSELEAVRRGGKPFPIELSLSEIYLKGERRLVAVSQDITERHQLERMRRELMAMVSHDLRTPL
ncbi:MAG: PAS domain S-box protein, partial [Cyanobacteria bacterium]|nr:PAS domain S-box protein [Cyanobacteriota bacterium]